MKNIRVYANIASVSDRPLVEQAAKLSDAIKTNKIPVWDDDEMIGKVVSAVVEGNTLKLGLELKPEYAYHPATYSLTLSGVKRVTEGY